MENKIPLIHTMSQDLDSADPVSTNPSPILAAQKDLESKIIPSPSTSAPNKWFLILRFLAIATILLLAIVVIFYFSQEKTNPNENRVVPQNQTQTVTTKYLFTVKDVWPSMADQLASSTGEATSSKNFYILITINDFDKSFDLVADNQEKILELAKENFDIETLSTFTNQTLNNQEIFVADGESKPIVYGFVGEKYLLFTSSINTWFLLQEKLMQNVNKNS